ncbi:MAG: hypothetical protein AAF702_13275 [Chloroflexota bacterium]
MIFTKESISHTLRFDDLIARLQNSAFVDGLLSFGSRATDTISPISDYDLLILVNQIPVGIFQMMTHIDGRMADVVINRTSMVTELLAQVQPVPATSMEGYFLQKVKLGEILYDKTGLLTKAKQYIAESSKTAEWLNPVSDQARYASWFWPNVGLYHIRRMVQSNDPIYETAVDMMLMGGIGSICREYFQIRNLPWQGEKVAIRLLEKQDPGFLALFRECVDESDRRKKVDLYTQLVERAIAPIGPLFAPGITAVCLEDRSQQPARVEEALRFWEELLE